MAVSIVKQSTGKSIREYLETLENVSTISFKYNGTDEITIDAGSVQLVWEGSEYYLVHITTDNKVVYNLDNCLPLTITFEATAS